MSKERYLIDGKDLPNDAKMKSGDDMKVTMTGAYFGSSAEVEVTYSMTSSNAGHQIAPAYSDLTDKFRNVPRKGEFAALKGESQILPETRLGEQVVEVTSVEQAVAMKDDIVRFMKPTTLANQLVYTTPSGKRMTYSQLMSSVEAHKEDNKNIQSQKNALIKDKGYETRFIDGKKVSPEYPEELLEDLAKLSEGQWSATGYYLRAHFKVKHTIAKDGKFYSGSLDQAQLDELAQKFDYKEHTSFWSGKLGRADIAVPVQSLDHVRTVLDYIAAHHPLVTEWGTDGHKKISLIRGVYIPD